MKYYIDNDGRIHAFELDGSQDHLISSNMTPITSDEVTEKLKPSQEALAELEKSHLKASRQKEVDELIVTISTGKTFDGDERSQDRMSRTINALNPGEVTTWVLSNNTPTQVTREELQEALRLSGIAQTNIWIKIYQ